MTTSNDIVNNTFHGLTKREYFAAQALMGILSNHGNKEKHNNDHVEHAVFYADRLIAALNNKGSF